MRDGRTDARWLGDSKIEYTARNCGHVYIIDHSKGRAPGGAWTPWMAKHNATRWSRPSGGGCIAVCPKCVKEGNR